MVKIIINIMIMNDGSDDDGNDISPVVTLSLGCYCVLFSSE